ncbi:UDP-glycosyltransferase family 36 member F1 [Carabus blaptoides fortunei]
MVGTFPSILCILAFASVCQCANILYISTLPSRSHHIWDHTLAMGLLERSHNITFFTHSPEMKTTNFTPIVIEGVYEEIAITVNYVDWYKVSTLNSIIGIYDWFGWICAKDLESKAIHSLLTEAKNGVKYDLIIMDMTTGQCLYPLIELTLPSPLA